MKKHVTLPVDFSAVVSQAIADHPVTDSSFFALEGTPELLGLVNDTLVNETLTAQLAVNVVAPVPPAGFSPYANTAQDAIIIPLTTESLSLNVFSVAEGAPRINFSKPAVFQPEAGIYLPSDCTFEESVSIAGSIFVKAGTAWSIEVPAESTYINYLVLLMGTSNDSYFAD